MATTSGMPRSPLSGHPGFYYPFFPPYAAAAGWSGNYVHQPSLYRSPYDAFFSGAPPPNSTELVVRGLLPAPEGDGGESPEASTCTALVRRLPPTQRDTPAEYPCPPTEDPDNPPVPIHPYLYEGSAAIVWDVRTNFRNNARRAADPSQPLSSLALKANAINAGGMNHKEMRILVGLEGGFPWTINVKRESGITVADVLTEVAAQLDKEIADSEKWIAKPERVAEAEAARKTNEGSLGAMKIRPEGDAMRRVDWLGKRTRFRGLAHSSHKDHEMLIRRRVHGHEKSNTWILILDEREE